MDNCINLIILIFTVVFFTDACFIWANGQRVHSKVFYFKGSKIETYVRVLD